MARALFNVTWLGVTLWLGLQIALEPRPNRAFYATLFVASLALRYVIGVALRTPR